MTDPRRISLITYAPRTDSLKQTRLHQRFNWNSPEILIDEMVRDLKACSHGHARFEIVEAIEMDHWPRKLDGFRYEVGDYIDAWQRRGPFHQPDNVDYDRILADHSILQKIAAGTIDEIWLMGFPYAGFYESIMGGPGAFWCNAPPLKNTTASLRRFVMMGFNYERGVGEMLENFGHRTESIMSEVFKGLPQEADLWQRFTRYEKSHPGQAEMGNVHFAPNSERDYDWGNKRRVLSRFESWREFPDLSGEARLVNCEEWGGGDIRAHHLWWFSHLPHAAGETNGILNDWWSYVLDPGLVQ